MIDNVHFEEKGSLMAVNYRAMSCSPEVVFDVLADGWLYPMWVVGASRMRAVDDAWPAPASSVHHSFGIWPVLTNDETKMLEWNPPFHAAMQAKGWPIGEARVVIDVQARGSGCVVRISEDAAEGPGKLVPKALRDVGLGARNVEQLRRLAFLAEGGAAKRRGRVADLD